MSCPLVHKLVCGVSWGGSGSEHLTLLPPRLSILGVLSWGMLVCPSVFGWGVACSPPPSSIYRLPPWGTALNGRHHLTNLMVMNPLESRWGINDRDHSIRVPSATYRQGWSTDHPQHALQRPFIWKEFNASLVG